MNASRPSAKAGIVFLGLVAALVIAWIAVDLRQRATQGPEAQASAGMYAFGDMVLGVAVFGVLALVPLALGLYWLRPVARFWSVLTWSAVLLAATGLLAVTVNVWDRNPTTGWTLLLSTARFSIMPFSALALLLCAAFAPLRRQRWLLAAAAVTDGVVFAGIVLVKFILRP